MDPFSEGVWGSGKQTGSDNPFPLSKLVDTLPCVSNAFNQGPVVQSFFSLTSSLMTNSLTVVAKVFSNTLIFFAAKVQNAKATHIFVSKNINVYIYHISSLDRNFNVTLANNVKSWATWPRLSGRQSIGVTIWKLHHEKTYLSTCAPSVDSNQPAIWSGSSLSAWLLRYPKCIQWRIE